MNRLLPRSTSVLAAFALVALSAGVARAATTGNIEGRVTDEATKKPLGGVTIIVSGPQGEQTEFSDSSGHYLITDLEPGEYVVRFFFANVKVERPGVLISADKTISISAAIPTAKAQVQEIRVTERAPTVDVATTQVQTQVSDELAKSTPVGRSYTSVLALAPAFLGGPVGTAGKERAELFRYGLPRLPGDAAMGALLTIPVYVAGSAHGLSAGGQMGLGITLLNLASAVFSPVGILLLPASAARMASGDHAGLIAQVDRTVRFSLLAAFAMLLGFEALAPWLLDWYLGPSGADYLPMARVLFLGAPAFAFFVALRSLLDAYYVVPRNGVNLLAALLVLLLGCAIHLAFGTPAWFLGVAVVVAMWYLAWLTFRDVRFVRSELKRRMERKGNAMRLVMVIAGQPDGNEFPFARRQARMLGERFGVEVERFFLRDRMSPLRLLRARRELKRTLRDFRPDLVMVHYGTVTGLFTVLSSSVPVVITFQGSDLNKTPSDGRVRDLLGRWFSQLAAFFAAGIICVSEGLRDRLWWRREKAHVLPMGADLSTFRPMDKQECRKSLGWSPHERVVLFNNNNPGVKRMDIAQAVVERVRAQVPEARLEALQGAIPPDRMPVLMNAADVLLLCSDQEGSPMMVKEAMACGLPVVTSDVGDVRARLKDVEPGAVVAQDPAALASAMLEVLRDPRRSNGRELAAGNGADAETLDARTFALLRSLIDP